jgi:hypothetical protein
LSGSERDRRSTGIWKRYCGTIAKAGGNGENKLLPAVAEGSCLLEQDTLAFENPRDTLYWGDSILNFLPEVLSIRMDVLHGVVQGCFRLKSSILFESKDSKTPVTH